MPGSPSLLLSASKSCAGPPPMGKRGHIHFQIKSFKIVFLKIIIKQCLFPFHSQILQCKDKDEEGRCLGVKGQREEAQDLESEWT